MSTAQELVVKAGRKGVDINNLVWIGDAVTKASNLSSLGNKAGISSIVFSENSYNNFIDLLVEEQKDKDPKSWFSEHKDIRYGTYYDTAIIFEKFNDWIENGMKD